MRRNTLIQLAVFVAALTISAFIIWLYEQNRLQAERIKVSEIARGHAHALEVSIDRALSATYALAALVRQGGGNVEDFEKTAGEMIKFYPGAAALQLAPGGIIRQCVPLAGNEGAIGHNLLKDPARTKEAFLARETGKLTLAGPFNLVQGGTGAAGRLPVFLDGADGRRSFWGFTVVLIRFPDVLNPAQLFQLEKRGYGYELWRIHPDSGAKQVIAASSSISLVKSIDYPLQIPNGTWMLSVAPQNGWGEPMALTIMAMIGVLFSVLALLLVRSVINTQTVAEQIAERLTSELYDREQEFRTLAENSPDIIIRYDRDCCSKYANPAHERSIGMSIQKGVDGAVAAKWASSLPFEEYLKRLRQVMESDAPAEIVFDWSDANGEINHYLLKLVPEHGPDGSVTGALVIGREITEIRRVEEENAKHLRFLERMDRVSRAIQGASDLEGMMTDVLEEVLEIYDCDRAYLMYPCDPDAQSWQIPMERTKPEFPGAKALGVDISKDEGIAAKLRLLIAADGPVNMGPGTEHALTGKTSEEFAIRSMMALALYPKVGKPWEFGIHQCSYGRAWDQDEERLFQEIGRRIEDALTGLIMHRDLRESEERYRRIVDTANEGIWVLDQERLTTFANARMTEMLGYSGEEMLGRPISDFIFAQDQDDHEKKMDNRRRGITEGYERRFRRKDGQELWTFVSATPMVDAEHRFIGSFAMFTDITERKHAENRLNDQLHFLQQLLDSIPIPIYFKDRDLMYRGCNRAFEEFVGFSREWLMGKNVFELAQQELAKTYHESDLALLNHPGRQMYEGSVRHVDGTLHRVEFNKATYSGADGSVAGIVGTIIDISPRLKAEEERKMLEAQLHQSQKMEAVGQLAGGVAHDFNNILTAITGYTSIVLGRMDMASPLLHFVEQILKAAERATELTNGLLAFSRRQVLHATSLDLCIVVQGLHKILRRLVPEDIDLRTETSGSLIITADKVQIEQLLINLVTNAKDAMPNGGALTVQVTTAIVEERFLHAHGMGEPGHYACITVTDTGHGMDEDTVGRIFEPFFTTKEVGKGTGLGMAIVFGIVKQHNGYISVNSQEGRGTTFRVYLPLVGEGTGEEIGAKGGQVPRGGTETILLVEDDDAVRELHQTILEDAGYKVIVAVDGRDALDKFSGQESGMDLLVTDVIMPQMNGKMLYEEISKSRPGMKVLFMSGYTKDIIEERGIMEYEFCFLAKPVRPDEFLRKVREILNGL